MVNKKPLTKMKRGELTTTQIVMIILLIVSFIVILYFFIRLNLGATSNAEICHNSVLLSSKSSGIIGAGGLQCKTDYVCISGGGKCANMDSTVTINVEPTNKNEIMKAIADQMAQCWWMFGEGKLDYQHVNVGVSPSGLARSGCAVCSIIEFDPTIQRGLQGFYIYSAGVGSYSYPLTYRDLMDYLETNTTTQGDSIQTYLHYLYGFYSVSDLLSKSSSELSNFYYSQSIPLSGQYAVLTGESKTSFTTLFFSQFPNLFTGATTPQYYFLPPVFIGTTNITKYFGSDCGGNFVTQS